MQPVLGFMGPSGAGKTTLIMELLARLPDRFGPVFSLTTRALRPTADDPLFFAHRTHDEIRALERDGRLFQVSEYAGNLYANERATVDALLAQKIGVMPIVEQGVKNFRAAGYRVIIIRVIPEGAPLSSDTTREKADAERTKENLAADFTLINSFAPGGKEKAIEKLLAFVSSLPK